MHNDFRASKLEREATVIGLELFLSKRKEEWNAGKKRKPLRGNFGEEFIN